MGKALPVPPPQPINMAEQQRRYQEALASRGREFLNPTRPKKSAVRCDGCGARQRSDASECAYCGGLLSENGK